MKCCQYLKETSVPPSTLQHYSPQTRYREETESRTHMHTYACMDIGTLKYQPTLKKASALVAT